MALCAFTGLGCGRDSTGAVARASATGDLAAIDALAGKLGGRRLVEPRLTAFPHQPCAPGSSPGDPIPQARCSEPPSVFDPDFRQAIRASRSPQRGSPSPEDDRGGAEDPDFHLLGLRALVWSDEAKDLDRAVAYLERAAGRWPERAEAHSDLAAAYLVRAQRENRWIDLVRAVDAAGAAQERDPGSLAATFNRAFGLELLHLEDRATAAWNRYLELDGGSEWAVEARRHLDALSVAAGARGSLPARDLDGPGSEITGRSRAARELVMNELLRNPGDRSADGRDALALARAIGATAEGGTGDRTAVDAVAALDGAVGLAERQALLSAHRHYGDAVAAIEDSEGSAASSALAAARRSLQRSGSAGGSSPLGSWIDFRLAQADYLRAAYAAARDRLEALVSTARARPYPALLGEAERLAGLLLSQEGRLAAALSRYRSAIDRFEEAGEPESRAGVETLIAGNYHLLGEPRRALEILLPALATADRLARGRRLLLYLEAGRGAEALALSRAAEAFYREAVALAEAAADPVLAVEAIEARSRLLAKTGRVEAALDGFARARAHATRVKDPEVARMQLGDLLLEEATAYAELDDPSAITALSGALESFERDEYRVQIPAALLLRARAHRRLGDRERERRDLERAVELFEELRAGRPREEWKASFLAGAREAFDRLAAIEAIDRGRPERALELTEAGRARGLVQRLGGHAPDGVSLPDLQRRLPQTVTVIELLVAEDRTLVWWIERDRFDSAVFATSEDDWTTTVEAIRAAILGNEASEEGVRSARPVGRGALDWAVGQTAPGRRLVLIPHGPLHRLPFAVWFLAEEDRFLIERNPFTVAPSLAAYLAALERDRRLASRDDGTLLAVGDPSFNRELLSAKRLPAAAEEATALAAARPDATLLTGEDATRRAFLDEGGRHSRILFAGHAVGHPTFPERSYLALAPWGTEDPDGLLYGEEIARLAWAKPRLLVLSACDTATGPRGPEADEANLAYFFLGSGVPTVAATLWPVEDGPASTLVASFFDHLLGHDHPAAALRAAQVEALSSTDPAERRPERWAAFQIYGANGASH